MSNGFYIPMPDSSFVVRHCPIVKSVEQNFKKTQTSAPSAELPSPKKPERKENDGNAQNGGADNPVTSFVLQKP